MSIKKIRNNDFSSKNIYKSTTNIKTHNDLTNDFGLIYYRGSVGTKFRQEEYFIFWPRTGKLFSVYAFFFKT